MTTTKRKVLLWTVWPLGSVLGFSIPFFLSWILISGIGEALAWDVDAAMDRSPVLFAALLALAFGLGGLGMGLVQWLFVRRTLQRSVAWMLGIGLGFAMIGPIYIAIWELLGTELANTAAGRLGSVTVQGLIAGPLAGWVIWRYALASRGVTRRDWLPFFTVAMIAAGAVSTITEIALSLGGGDASPLGILAFALITAYAWQRLPPGATTTVSRPGPSPFVQETPNAPRS